jgi:hypothetical protein
LHVCQRIVKAAEKELTQEELAQFKARFIDYTEITFPEVNPIDLYTQ